MNYAATALLVVLGGSFSSHLLPIVTAELMVSDGKLEQPLAFKNPKKKVRKLEIDIEYGSHSTVAATTFDTRVLLCGEKGGSSLPDMLPGPVIRTKAGQTLQIRFNNKMEEQEGTNTNMNEFSFPDESNLHFHGLHVSGEAPSDDPSIIVPAQSSYDYTIKIPEDHMGGTHWIHPFRHGSSTLQVGGGAAMTIIVEDEDGDVPPEVASAKEVIMMVQQFDQETMEEKAAGKSGDKKFKLETLPELDGAFRLVNGKFRPDHYMKPGRWERWRVIWGGWDNDPLQFHMDGVGRENCEMHLLAKDGIYVKDYPRTMYDFPIPTGGRADIMVRCNGDGNTVTISDYKDQPLMRVMVKGEKPKKESLPLTNNWKNFPSPDYLRDLRFESPAKGCDTCATAMGDDQINGMSYDPTKFLHLARENSIVDREVSDVDDHPYHQNVRPYQLTEFNGIEGMDAEYFKIGDYHDSLFISTSPVTNIRYDADKYAGRMSMYCAKLTHSDEGMRSQELIGGDCACSPRVGATGFALQSCSNNNALMVEYTGKNCKQYLNMKKKGTKRCKDSLTPTPDMVFIKDTQNQVADVCPTYCLADCKCPETFIKTEL